LGNKWQDSEDYRILTDELDPILDKAIDQPDGIAPRYATNPLTQVSDFCLQTSSQGTYGGFNNFIRKL